MKLRAVLLTSIKDQISERKLTQSEAAKLFGVTQPRISDLIRGKINLFALDTLVNMTVAAGLPNYPLNAQAPYNKVNKNP